MPKYDYKDSNKKFVNPYNFVPVLSKVKRDIDATKENNEGLKTGYFECSLVAKTPLAIPDVKDNVLNRYPAFSIGGKYAIPASSLRGVIRSVYETVTDSCMVTTNGDELITKRSNIGTFSACVLKKEPVGWQLYKADRVPLVTNDNKDITGAFTRFDVMFDKKRKEKSLVDGTNEYYYGEHVYIKSAGPGHTKASNGRQVWKNSVSQIAKTDLGGMSEGYLYLGEKIFGKHAESVFVNLNKTTYTADVVKKSLEGLEITLDMYNDSGINKNLSGGQDWYSGYKNAKAAGIIPLWYKEDNGHLYLSLAAIGRMAYFTDMEALTGKHNRCCDRKSLCPACAVFGMVGDVKAGNQGYGSNVRFTEGMAANVSVDDKYTILKELGSPKPSYLKFYSKNGLDYDAKGAQIRGRKFYWHIPKAAVDDSIYRTDKPNGRNSQIQLFKTNSTFKFKVFYDNLTTEQVKKLAWAITLGGNDTNNMHKIGHAKPLGLGSIKITIDKNIEREFDIENGIYNIHEVSTEYADINTEDIAVKELLNITDFNAIDDNLDICYPYVYLSAALAGMKVNDNDVASHKWFSENNKATDGVLPDISDANKQPHVAKEVVPQGNGGNGNRPQGNGGNRPPFNPGIGAATSKFKIDQVYELIITDYVKSKDNRPPSYVKAKCENTNVQFPCKLIGLKDASKAKVGEKVSLRCTGFRNNYPSWDKA